MIELITDCKDCVHNKVCRNRDNAKIATNKLKNMTYGDGPNDDYDWDIMMDHMKVHIRFYCDDFMRNYATRK